MGGDSDPDEVARWAEYVRPLKTAWYSGRTSFPRNPRALDFLKLGPYIESLGGLKSPNTNQRLYKRVGDEWQDITSSFWKKNL
jgi:anaerobic ribonucleoside-triphosphate reductase activating protein